MSLFNMGGRFFWASTSDFIGRKNTYFCFFALGTLLYALVPTAGAIGSVAAVRVCFLLIISMYGGGFATVPAYLRDMFGTRYVGAIHGLLITAWSMAGIFGPVLVNYIREYNISHGVPKADAYNVTMYVMAGLLVVGFFCNLFIRPVNTPSHDEGSRGPRPRPVKEATMNAQGQTSRAASGPRLGVRRNPLAWGVVQTLQRPEAVPVAKIERGPPYCSAASPSSTHSSFTRATPSCAMPSSRAALTERSMMRSLLERAAVVDAHDDAAAILEIGDAHLGIERQCAMRRGQRVHVEGARRRR